jgi:hypothetical protein
MTISLDLVGVVVCLIAVGWLVACRSLLGD